MQITSGNKPFDNNRIQSIDIAHMAMKILLVYQVDKLIEVY